ncbi:unnamed protein product [Trichobilharzia szidati]|nr:unnamed protein product [Trichobilharzia szidati]
MFQENTFQSPVVGVQLNKSVDKESTQWIMYSPLLFITIGIGLLYFLVLIIFVCIKHFIISNKGYPISVGYQKFVDNSNNDQSSDFQYHQLLLHPFPVKLNNHTLFYATSRKGEDYIQTFLPGRQTLYHPTIVPSHRHCCQDVNGTGKRHSTWLHQNTWNTKSSKLKRIFLFTHLAFRVFYTFLFTFSVAVSLIFSLQPSSRPTFDSMIHWSKVSQESLDYNHRMQRNMQRSSSSSVTSMPTIRLDQTHLIGPIIRLQTEARWIEEFTEQELKRQLDYVERMKLACQHAMTVELTDALREGKHLVKTRLEKWQLNSTIAQNTDNINGNTLLSTNELAGHHFNKQRSLFDRIYEQVSQQIDFRRVKSFKVYSNMLNSVFHSGWLQYAKRMLNTSDNLDRTPKHFSNAKIHSATKLNFQDSMRRFYEIAQQRSGIKASYVTLMNYMNFYQSDSVQLLPLQLLESLKKIFAPANHYISMFYLSSEVHDQLRQSQIKHQPNHQTINLKNPFLQKTRQERVFVTTNDLEEYIDGTLNPIEDAITQHSSNQAYKLISENFIEYIKRNANRNSEDYIKYSDKHSAIPVMTLTHIRLSLLILDCLIIVYRFFHTYEILKAIWTGQKLFVDASSWLERQVNVMSSENKDIGYFHEESEQITGRGRNSSHSDHTAYNETDSKLFSRTTIFQCLPQYQNRYECRHDRQALFQSSSCSPAVPRNSQSSETVSPIMSNNIMQSQCTNKSKENFQSCPTYSQLSNMPCKSLPYNSLISIGPPLSLPPSSSFGIEQNTGCMLGVRTACCRKSHYISSIVGLTVLILLFGLVLIQMYKPTGVISKKSSTSTNYAKQNFIQYRGNRIPYLSTQINFFRPYHELLIREHSKRLNQDWLGWTRRNELAMRGRVLNYLSRFKHELAFFDKQMEAENSVIRSLLSQTKKSSSSTSTAKSDKDYNKPVQYPTSPVFNSEFLFRQQICHFLPVVPVPIIDDDTDLNSKGMSSSLRGMMKPQNIKQIIWTATISTFVDFDWNSQEQANRLFITAIIVGVVMISCIGVVDLGGKILKMLYINPAVSLSDIQRWRSSQKLTHEKELKNYDQNSENIILISPQPAPVIPWPSDLLFNVNGKLKTTQSNSNPTCRQTSSPGSSVSILKEPEAQLPLTAFYLDSNIVFTPTSTPQIYNTSKPIQLDDVSHSIPLLIAHSPSSTPIIALKTDPLSSTNQLSGVLYGKT